MAFVRSFVVYIQPNRRSWRGYITADKKAPRDPRPVRLFLDLSAESLFTPAGGCPDGHERGEGATTLLSFFFLSFPRFIIVRSRNPNLPRAYLHHTGRVSFFFTPFLLYRVRRCAPRVSWKRREAGVSRWAHFGDTCPGARGATY